jgi:O-antigen/teichoic acid export membrane protein
MNKQLTNAVYGVLDYTSYPLGMLLVAPVVLHRQGAAEYGLWITSTAVISAGGIIASGFSDANIQRAAQHRGKGDHDSISDTTGSMLGINLVLGALIAICVWIAAPLAANHMAVSTLTTAGECLFCLRAASIGIFLRALEAVAVSTHRAFEDYRYTVRISTICRISTLGIAALLACLGQPMSSIVLATVLVLAIGVYLQFRSLRPFLQPGRLRPRVHAETRHLLRLGVFPWLQALTSIIFGQLDRILLGVYVGTLAVAPYALCVQFAQPIVGVAASGLSFLFPYLSKRVDSLSAEDLKRTLLKAFACNLLIAFCGVLGLLTFGTHLIQLWAGATVARSANDFLVPITVGSALAGLGTTAIYAMQSMGMFRVVALITIGGRGGMLLVMSLLLHRFGIQGLAYSRLCYGVIPLLIYIPLYRAIHTKKQRSNRDEQPLSVAYHEVPTL